MASDRSPRSDREPDPRRRNALIAAGVLGLAAIAWNADDWWGSHHGDDDPVVIQFSGDEANTSDAIRERVNERIRGRVDEEQRDTIDEALDDAGLGDTPAPQKNGDEPPSDTVIAGGAVRIQRGEGDGVTITIDPDRAQ